MHERAHKIRFLDIVNQVMQDITMDMLVTSPIMLDVAYMPPPLY